jgi:magnesium transporter
MLSSVWWLDPESGDVKALSPFEVLEPRYRFGVRWLHFTGTDRDDVDWLREAFGFHPLPLEDCLKSGQRPKLETYDGYVFLDVYAAETRPGSAELTLHEFDCFLAPGYLITSHADPHPVTDEVLERWKHAPDRLRGGVGLLAHLLLDSLVDGYFPVVDRLEERLEALEESLFVRFDDHVVTEIFRLKKALVQFRRIVAPTRDVCLLMLRQENGFFDAETRLYLQDVYDHLIRVADSIDTFRDLVASAIDAYLSVAANRTNDTMKRLTSISTVLMTAALVAGFYGMNFDLPEFHWKWGVAFVYALIFCLSILLTWWFKRRGYF